MKYIIHILPTVLLILFVLALGTYRQQPVHTTAAACNQEVDMNRLSTRVQLQLPAPPHGNRGKL